MKFFIWSQTLSKKATLYIQLYSWRIDIQINKTENLETDPHVSGQLIFNKDLRNSMEKALIL